MCKRVGSQGAIKDTFHLLFYLQYHLLLCCVQGTIWGTANYTTLNKTELFMIQIGRDVEICKQLYSKAVFNILLQSGKESHDFLQRHT